MFIFEYMYSFSYITLLFWVNVMTFLIKWELLALTDISLIWCLTSSTCGSFLNLVRPLLWYKFTKKGKIGMNDLKMLFSGGRRWKMLNYLYKQTVISYEIILNLVNLRIMIINKILWLCVYKQHYEKCICII